MKNSSPESSNDKSRPQIIILREYGGKQSAKSVFLKLIEKQADEKMKKWFDSKAS